jgi:hypothetical protein
MGTKTDAGTKPTDKDARDAYLDLWSAARASEHSLYVHLGAFGNEISQGDTWVEHANEEARQRQAEIDDLGPFDDPPDDELPPWVNADIASEIQEKDREAMLGVSFVLCQTRLGAINAKADQFYRVLEQVLGQREGYFGRKKEHLARGEKLAGFDYSRVRVIWELANYFKHADQWTPETWEEQKWPEAPTVEVAKALGLTDHSSLKLAHGAELLGVGAGHEVEKLAADVNQWAELVVSEAKKAMAPLPPAPDPGF